MKQKISILIRTFISIIAFAMLAWVNLNFFTAGTVIGSLLFGGIFAACIFWRPLYRLIKRIWSKLFGKIALIVFGSFTAICAVCCVVFSVFMGIYADYPAESVDAVIVLGCQVRGETPSTMLAQRLDAALPLLEAYPQAVCVVSGGQGSGEDISEAEAMRRYLVEHGISEDRIIPEDRSVSTRENIAFSYELLKQQNDNIEGIVIATNEFHQFRAELYARKNGFKAGHISNKTPTMNLLNYWVREWAAIFDALVRG